MKKFISVIGILTVCVTFFACKDVSEVEDQKLAIEAKAEGNVIAVPYVENLSYVNIFRTDENDETYNIGQITPLKKEMCTFLFTDALVNSGKKYTYYARYNIKGTYKYSSVSGQITTATGSLAEEAVTVGATDKFTFKTSDMTLTPSATMTGLTGTEYHICLAVGIAGGSSASTFAVTADGGNLTGAITLSSTLTANFMNKPIALKGLLLEKTAESEDKSYKIITWSKPVVVKVMDEAGTNEVTDSFTVTNATVGGEYDYSGRAAVVTQPESSDYSD